jgi:hypothetical protein
MFCLIVWSQVTVASNGVSTPRCHRSYCRHLRSILGKRERETEICNAGGEGRKMWREVCVTDIVTVLSIEQKWNEKTKHCMGLLYTLIVIVPRDYIRCLQNVWHILTFNNSGNKKDRNKPLTMMENQFKKFIFLFTGHERVHSCQCSVHCWENGDSARESANSGVVL